MQSCEKEEKKPRKHCKSDRMHEMIGCNTDPLKTRPTSTPGSRCGKPREARHHAQPAVAELRFGLLVLLVEFWHEARHDRIRLRTRVCHDQSAIIQPWGIGRDGMVDCGGRLTILVRQRQGDHRSPHRIGSCRCEHEEK